MIRSLFFLIFFNIFPPPSSPFILHLLIPSSLICLPPRAELSFRRRGAIVWAARSYAFDGPYDSFWQALCIVLIINGLRLALSDVSAALPVSCQSGWRMVISRAASAQFPHREGSWMRSPSVADAASAGGFSLKIRKMRTILTYCPAGVNFRCAIAM